MGIRYYAYTWPAEDIDQVLRNPGAALSVDPFADAWLTPPDEQPDMLYLDKMWPDFQQLTASDGREHPRPCHRMFEGEVSYCADEGWSCWHPWIRAIAPDETGVIARDLAALTDAEITARFGTGNTSESRFRNTRSTLCTYLDTARKFTERAAGQGRGLVYLIG
ncbi:DUF1877 domain-containing protein [Zhihengliuella salsuginis]|nr:DUF1877 domain-containing protein [Zhihengliuella salsuginis]